MDYLSERARRLSPYVAGEQPKDMKYIKLNTNENPYPPSPKVYDAISGASKALPLYPDPNAEELCSAIAAVEGLEPDFVFCGNGSDEVLSLAFCAFFDDKLPVLFPDVTYSFYPVFAGFYQIPVKTVPVNDKFEIVVEDYLRPASGVIICNPNAPTGICLNTAAIEKLLAYHASNVVIVDEAYIAFGGVSVAPLIKKYPNLLVVRTFSKSHSLAGLRVGYALGQPHLISGLFRVKDSFNSYPLDRIAAGAAKEAILDTDYYAGINSTISETRDRFSKALEVLDFEVLPSKANFVFASHKRVPAKDLFLQLRTKGILVRHFSLPRIENYLRITIGTENDMNACIVCVEEILSGFGAL